MVCTHHHHLVEPDLTLPPERTWQITFDTRGNPEFTSPTGTNGVRTTRQHDRYAA